MHIEQLFSRHPSSEMKIIRNLIIFILLPFSFIMLQYTQMLVDKSDRDYYAKVNIIENQINASRQAHVDNIYHATQSVESNQALMGFLITEYTNKNWSYYYNIVHDGIKGRVTDSEQYKTHIFYTNPTIPQGFNTLYKLSYIENLEPINEFLESEKEECWIMPTMILDENTIKKQIFHNRYTYLKKIFIEDELVAIVSTSIDKKEMNRSIYSQEVTQTFSEFKESEEYIIVNNSSYEFKSDIQIDDALKRLEKGRYVKNVADINNFPQKMIYIWDENMEGEQLLLTTILVLVFMVLIMITIIIFVRRIFHKIFECVYELDHSVKNRLYNEIPIYPEADKRKVDTKEIFQIKTMFNDLIKKIQELMILSARQSSLAKESQLQALQHQINPHFMYNTLEVFSYRMEKYKHFDEADAISAFSEMLRYNISTTRGNTSLRDEIGLINNYIKIQRLKYNVDFKVNIPEELMDEEIMRFILQPIIENCFIHGYNGEVLNINLSVIDLDSHMMIKICDNGKGMSEEEAAESNKIIQDEADSDDRIGTKNINKRLRLFYSGDYKFEISSKQNKYTLVSIVLPKNSDFTL